MLLEIDNLLPSHDLKKDVCSPWSFIRFYL